MSIERIRSAGDDENLRRSAWPIPSSPMRKLPLILVTLVWIGVLARLMPIPEYDRGIFVSVAARLAADDRLYADVWDNKEPFFYDRATWSTSEPRPRSPHRACLVVVGCCIGYMSS